MHHEQAAAFAAEAYGRITGLPGVALATSGPGATNLITGIGSCYFDSTPALFITGQVNRNEQKGDRKIRQAGFQETDIVSIVKPITKMAVKIEAVEDLPILLEKAFALSMDGRPGPVLIDIPMDIQRSKINVLKNKTKIVKDKLGANQKVKIEQLIDSLKNSNRPLILAGGGIRASQTIDIFRKVVNQLKIPVVNSLMAVDVLPYTNPYRVGMIGTYGNRWANLALSKCDLLIVLGSRLDVRQTGSDTGFFMKDKKIFHVDIDENEMNNSTKMSFKIHMHLLIFFENILKSIRITPTQKWQKWIQEINKLRFLWPDYNEVVVKKGINPNAFMHSLSQASKKRTAGYVVDVGQHQMWAAQSIEIGPKQGFFTSGGMGSMGFSLPAAIGAAITEKKTIVAIAGDGGFQCNIQELQTIAQKSLPVKMIVINNKCLGMVRQFQENYFEHRYQSTVWGYSAPDFEKVSISYGIPAKTVKDPKDIDKKLAWLFKNPDKPALLQVIIDSRINAFPKTAFGRPLTSMEPFCE